MDFDIVIVGGGPAGLFAAYKISENSKLRIAIVDRGKRPEERKCPEVKTGKCYGCSFCDMMYGIGGSGLFSDGKLNLDPRIGANLIEFTKSYGEAMKIITYIDKIFVKHGVPEHKISNPAKAHNLVKQSARAGITFIPINQRHIGSDELPAIITAIMKELESRGVKFILNTEVKSLIIDKNRISGVQLVSGKKLGARYVIVATGRIGAHWIGKQVSANNIPVKYNPIDVGVRVEVPSVIMEDVTAINWDPKFHIRTPLYDDFVRTFCTCPRGFVVEERYDGFILVNGHSMRHKHSNNTNFAFLTKIGLTEPVENTIAYGRSIAELATTIGGGKPLIQRFGDLRQGRRSTPARIRRSLIEPTFLGATAGDISMALPQRIVIDIIEGLEKLDRVIPGVASDSTLLYAPEIKFHAMRIETDNHMETNIRNLYVAGDGAGVSRGIIGAAATGVIAAQSILEKELGC